MNRAIGSRRWRFVFAVVTLVAFVAVVSLFARPTDAKTAKIQPDWSRGLRIGSTPWSQPPAIAISNDGKRVHLVWNDSRASGVGVHYVQLNERAELSAEQWLGNMEGTPQSVRILLDQQERPHVFVMARLPGESNARVVHWMLDANGTPRMSSPVSPTDADVQSFDVATRQGLFDLFFAAEPGSVAQGLYYARLNADGNLLDQLQLNTSAAKEVSVQVDQRDAIHLIWGEATSPRTRRVLYAEFAQIPGETEGVQVAKDIKAPAKIGLDDRNIYILWGEAIKGNAYTGAGTGYTSGISFLFGEPQRADFHDINIPELGQIDLIRHDGAYQIHFLSSTTTPPGIGNTNLIFAPSPIGGQHGELAVAQIAALAFPGLSDWLGRPRLPQVVDIPPATPQHRLFRLLEYGVEVRILPVLLLIHGGQVLGYQIIGYGDGISFNPVVAADANGNLYAAWLNGSTWEGFRVYFAATTSAARDQLDMIDLTDVLVGIATTGWKMLAGLALLPFFPIIVVPALLVALVYTVLGSQSELLYDRRSYVILVLGCAAYWVTKQVVLGAILSDPLIGRELEGWDRTALVWGMQLGIAAIAGAITWRQIATRKINSAMWAILLFCTIDMLLSMLSAGPTLAVRG
jgi:hypothetical protein